MDNISIFVCGFLSNVILKFLDPRFTFFSRDSVSECCMTNGLAAGRIGLTQ